MGIDGRHPLLTERTQYMSPTAAMAFRLVLKGYPGMECMKQAITGAMKANEILCCRVAGEKDGSVFYESMGEPVVKVTGMGQGDADTWKTILREQERLSFALQSGELIRFFLMDYDGKTELLMLSHHLAGDGVSMLHFVMDVLNALEGIFAPDPQEMSRKPVQLLKGRDLPGKAGLRPVLRILVALLNRQWQKTGHVFSFEEYGSFYATYWKSRRTGVYTGVIEGDNLMEVLAFAKKHKITVNSLLAAAVLEEENQELGIPVSIRPEGYEGMGNYASGITVSYAYDGNLDFGRNAEAVHNLIYEKIRNVKHKYFLLKFLSALKGSLLDASYYSAYGAYDNGAAREAADMLGFCGEADRAGLTNLTGADWIGDCARYPICQLQFIPPLPSNAKYMLGVVTYGGRMSLTLHYPGGDEEGRMQRKLERIMERLVILKE